MKHRSFILSILVLSDVLVCLLFSAMRFASPSLRTRGQEPTPVPEVQLEGDRLAIPVLPENPTQVDLGNSVYYYNCMPCHGDRGQGLTDEWRNVWVEDHRDCWAKGCHGGRQREGEGGFYLKRYIPGVQNLDRFPLSDDLFAYLRQTHPPQRPGALSDQEYWSVTAFLLFKADKLSPGQTVGPVEVVGTDANEMRVGILSVIAFAALMLLISFLLIVQIRR